MNTRTRVKIKKPGVTRIFTSVISLCFICIGRVDAEPPAPTAKLRVLTYNVFVGFKNDAKRHAQAVEWIAAQHPDVVALQEINEYTEEKLSEDARAWGHPNVKLCITKSGYHLGITSRKPIENIHLIVKKGICHGMIHGSTHGIDFFVLHLAPQSEEIRIPETEIILTEIAEIQSSECPTILLGDFNSSSPLDADYFRKETKHHPKFNVMSRYLDSGHVDLVHQHQGVLTEKQASVPTPLGKKDEGFWRLDYILASTPLAKKCVSAHVVKEPATSNLSDHYPVIADFAWP
jgi:endonuclease/exonuclease/phosphatase family metal-dependent hydrolase